MGNNGGNAPAASLVRLNRFGQGAELYGGTPGTPFSCPGGLFEATIPGGSETLWVNDEGYKITNTDCGATGADQGDQVGRVLEFLPADLLSHRLTPRPETFNDWNKIGTSSPGFGGIAVVIN